MQDRRQMITRSARLAGMLASLGLLPKLAQAQPAGYPAAAFEAHGLAELTKALGAATPAESKEVTITGPDVAENGAVVPLVAAATAPGVKRLLVLVEKNPAMLSAIFHLGEGVEASISTRVKMAQSSNVYAVAMTGDGKVLYAVKDIKVTLGGCGG